MTGKKSLSVAEGSRVSVETTVFPMAYRWAVMIAKITVEIYAAITRVSHKIFSVIPLALESSVTPSIPSRMRNLKKKGPSNRKNDRTL